MNRLRKLRKNKDITKKKVNNAKSTTLKLALIMLNFIFATFAWFTYTMILNSNVNVNISAWQVDFKDNDSILGTAMQFQVGTFYPGMDDYTKSIEIVNLGDRAAKIEYDVQQIKILGQEYTIKKTQEAGDSKFTLYSSETTDNSTGLKTVKLLNNSKEFPFEITITHSIQIDIENPNDERQNKGKFEICFTWPYEITTLPETLPDDLPEGLTDDEKIQELNTRKTTLDTRWGYNIANFYKSQSEGDTTQGIEITLQAIAKQII